MRCAAESETVPPTPSILSSLLRKGSGDTSTEPTLYLTQVNLRLNWGIVPGTSGRLERDGGFKWRRLILKDEADFHNSPFGERPAGDPLATIRRMVSVWAEVFGIRWGAPTLAPSP
jgi:hypothetical protein